MCHAAVIGAGVTGVTTAYSLVKRGFNVTIFDRHRYAAMETSYANGAQLSASNAEAWNHPVSLAKQVRRIFQANPPLRVNLRPGLQKYGWLIEFLLAGRRHEANTKAVVRLALSARDSLLALADEEDIDFDLERRGILHFYASRACFAAAQRTNKIFKDAGVDRVAVTPEEMRQLEPALSGEYYSGFYTPADYTRDIHKSPRALAARCASAGATFIQNANVNAVIPSRGSVEVVWNGPGAEARQERCGFDVAVICAGAHSVKLAARAGDRVSIYPVKGYSITLQVSRAQRESAPWVGLVDDADKVVSSRLGAERYRVAGFAEINGLNRDIRQSAIQALMQWVERCHPALDTSRFAPWAGLRPMTPNLVPRVGAGKHQGIYYNTGHGHLGWTLCAATSEIVADMIEEGRRQGRASCKGSLQKR